jgi:hypothetical protein
MDPETYVKDLFEEEDDINANDDNNNNNREDEDEEFDIVTEELSVLEETGTDEMNHEQIQQEIPEMVSEEQETMTPEKPDKRILLEYLNGLQEKCLSILETGQSILDNLAESPYLIITEKMKQSGLEDSLNESIRRYFDLLNEVQRGLRYQLKYISRMDISYASQMAKEEILWDLMTESCTLIARDLAKIREKIDVPSL